jgi:hypothetical protein
MECGTREKTWGITASASSESSSSAGSVDTILRSFINHPIFAASSKRRCPERWTLSINWSPRGMKKPGDVKTGDPPFRVCAARFE